MTASRKDAPSGGRGLTRITVNLTPRAALALDGVVERTGDSRTDVVNRSLLMYDLLLDLLARGDVEACRSRVPTVGRSGSTSCENGPTASRWRVPRGRRSRVGVGRWA